MARPLVIQTEELDPEPAKWLADRAELAVCPSTDPRFPALLERAEGLVVRTYTRVDKGMLDAAPRLKVVGRAGVAVENIDLAACRQRGIRVVHAPGANTRAVVEFVMSLLADALRPRTFLTDPVPAEKWHEIRRIYIGRRQMDELTLGIYGMGRIGTSIARLAAALNMKAMYHDIVEIPEARRSGAAPVSRDRLLADSDVLTIHVDSRPENKHLLNAAAFGRLKKDVLFINTSRGFVVDPTALRTFLLANPQARAMIDVHDPFEPITPDYPLLGLPNARLSPHLAAGTERAKRNMSWVVRDVWRVLNGEQPEFEAHSP